MVKKNKVAYTKGRYIESFEATLDLQSKLREVAKREGISVSAVIRRAIEKEVDGLPLEEIQIPFSDRFERTYYKPLSEILGSLVLSINKMAESNPELVKSFITSVKRLSKKLVSHK